MMIQKLAAFLIVFSFILAVVAGQNVRNPRMMTGGERSVWSKTQWDTGPLLSEDLLYRNQAYYTFGYTFGYLGEQCVSGVCSAA